MNTDIDYLFKTYLVHIYHYLILILILIIIYEISLMSNYEILKKNDESKYIYIYIKREREPTLLFCKISIR